jgi:hypothetical protein
MYNLVAKDWRELSQAASRERDPKRFMELIEELNDALDQQYGMYDERSDNDQPKRQFEAA